MTAGVALLVLAVVRAGDTLQFTQPMLLAAAAVLLLGAFIARERTARAPLLDLALFKDRGIAGANLVLIAVGAFNAGQVLLVTLYLQQGRGLSPVLTGLCFVPQAAGAFALSGPASRLVPSLGPRRSLAIALSIALLALAAAVAVMAGSLLTATRQCGSALGVAILSATLVAVHGTTGHRTEVAMFVAAGFALAGLLATRVVPHGPAPAQTPQPQHLFRHHAGGIP
jgi:hypothetical protein